MSEIRHNRLTNEWVIIAPERAKRGGNLGHPKITNDPPIFLASCPFCPGNEAMSADEQYRCSGPDGRWTLRSVTNKFSVLSPTGDVGMSENCGASGETVNGVGLHEVIIEGRRHGLTLELFSIEHVQHVVEVYRHRFRAFYTDPRIHHVIIFKNHGLDAGASQQHPHSQIVGLPIVPGQVMDRLENMRRFYNTSRCCMACAIIAEEQAHGGRIVAENTHFIALIPYAALSPYHLWIFPKVHGACFSEQAEETWPAFAEIVRDVLLKIYGVLGDPPFNLIVRSLGPEERHAPHFHWYISVVPRVNKTAGFELGTGMYVNPSIPDTCAQQLRDFPTS